MKHFPIIGLAIAMVSLHSSRNPEIEVGTRNCGIDVIGLAILLFGEIWTLGAWFRKAVECFKCCFMGHTSRNMENNGAEDNLNYEDLT